MEATKLRATRNELPLLIEAGESSVRGADWGDMRVALISVPAGTDFSPLLKGLPHDRCQGPHWGYVLKGRLRITYGDGREEVLGAGDFYHMPPDHTGLAEEETEFLEVAPPGPHQEFVEAALRNIAQMQKGAAAANA
jgi:mannose-6-phosphate isomerase-like protein (cupin superfamily)